MSQLLILYTKYSDLLNQCWKLNLHIFFYIEMYLDKYVGVKRKVVIHTDGAEVCQPDKNTSSVPKE